MWKFGRLGRLQVREIFAGGGTPNPTLNGKGFQLVPGEQQDSVGDWGPMPGSSRNLFKASG
jgi:hypothetical protein